LTPENFQKFFDKLSESQLTSDFAQNFPETLSQYFLMADALRQLVQNTWPDCQTTEKWVDALLLFLEDRPDAVIAVPLIPEGGVEFAGCVPGEIWELDVDTIMIAVNIVMRIPVNFVKNPAGQICGWNIGDEDTFIWNRADLRKWMTIVSYVRDNEIPIMADEDFELIEQEAA